MEFNCNDLPEELKKIYILFKSEFEEKLKYFSKVYKINPTKFYISNDTNSRRAYSGYNHCEKSYFITITPPFIIDFYNDLITNNKINFKSENGLDLKSIFIDGFIEFLFHHEFRHLLQNRENNNLFPNNTIDRHTYEYDADFMGIRFLLDYAFKIYEKYKLNNYDTFREILIKLISSICISFLIMYDGKNKIDLPPFYLEEKDHPHPMVRIIYIIELYHNQIDANYNQLINFQDLLNSTFENIKNYFINDDKIKNLICCILNKLNDINEYVDKLYETTISNRILTMLRDKDTQLLNDGMLFSD